MMTAEGFIFACPGCRGELLTTGQDVLCCQVCDLSYPCIDGVWHMLPEDRKATYRQFIAEYETVRRAEGRGSNAPAFYRSLPFKDLSGNRSTEWAIRGRSFQVLLDKVIIPLEESANERLLILDLGSGNGWLSNRLAQRGHLLGAVDLMTNQFDGLGAHRYYQTRFIPIQAEFDRLPLAGGQADLVIFNASFHYSVDYVRTLEEALRVLSGTGQVIVLDTPIYWQASSGARMVQERQGQFQRHYGFPSNTLPSENYLTDDRIRQLGSMVGLTWRKLVPNYGLGWVLRPYIHRLRRQREPARFAILIGER
jgi:SAM-dependent methyltransferase